MNKHTRTAWLLILILLLTLPFTTIAGDDTWVLVDTGNHRLVVYDGETELTSYNGIAIGRGGATRDRVRGDNTTPLGDFRIGWINPDSRYHIFLGFDFPTFGHASRAYAAGVMSLDDYLKVVNAARLHRLPPQTTSLGGHIGIHGLGNADPGMHRLANWTRGCIALTDAQIVELNEHVTIGTRVIVR